jgi:hypothetical protein
VTHLARAGPDISGNKEHIDGTTNKHRYSTGCRTRR